MSRWSVRASVGALGLSGLLLLGCDGAEACDPCESDEDCAEIDAIEGASCVTGKCCVNPSTRCTEEQVKAACGDE